MYDDDSEGEDGKIGKKVTQGVKRVARGTRRMSLLAADNVKNVATGVNSNVKKVAQGAVNVGGNIKKKKKKKKKKDKEKKKKKKRGRSESPRRSTNAAAKPPVTKPGGLRSIFSPKRWRSASPMIGKGKKKSKAETVESEDELEPLAPLPTFQNPPVTPEPVYGNTMMNGGEMNGAILNGGSMNTYSNRQTQSDGIGVSIRSLSSAQRHQRIQQQEKIERDNKVPLFSVLLQSKYFLKYCDLAFDMVDSNGDDVVDETELYAGLLLIHLKLGSFLGPAACKPLSRERCDAMFQRFDYNGSGGLDRNEFQRVMMVLFGNIFARVAVQYVLTIIVVPLIAKSVLDFLTWDSQRFWDYWTKPKALRRMGQEFTLDRFVDWTVTSYPSTRRTFFTTLSGYFRIGSDSFWETFPLTFMTIVLGLVIAPFVLFYFDDFFQFAVDWKEKRDKMPPAKKR